MNVPVPVPSPRVAELQGGSANEIATSGMPLNSATMSQIRNLLCQGITQFAHSSKDVVMGQSRPSLMESMGESDAKRRLVQVSSVPSALPSMVGPSVRVRYGFRGVRVGEDSNPGPPERVRPRGEEVGEVELDRLEHELTLIDSDEEPLLRVGEGRNVLPRIETEMPRIVHPIVEDGASVSGTPHCRTTTSANEEVVEGELPIQRDIELSREVVAIAMDSDDTESMVSNNSLILAMECDLAADVREEGPNVVHQAQGPNVRRRLRLTWNEDVDPQVHIAETFIQNLAERVGPVAPGSVLPWAIRRQRSSPMNVPLMWSAAGDDLAPPILTWLIECASLICGPSDIPRWRMPSQ